jgi:hypothetical protein
MIDLLQTIDFWHIIWPTYHMQSIIDMERFSHLFWANLMSYHFSLFLNFTLLYIFLIYDVFFFNEALKDFNKKKYCFKLLNLQMSRWTNLVDFSMYLKNLNCLTLKNIKYKNKLKNRPYRSTFFMMA